jgi:hypothetical protein
MVVMVVVRLHFPLSGSSSRSTTGFDVFAESGIPLGEGPFPLTEAITESLLSVKASRRTLYRRRTLRRELPVLLTVDFRREANMALGEDKTKKKIWSGHCGPTNRPTVPSAAAATFTTGRRRRLHHSPPPPATSATFLAPTAAALAAPATTQHHRRRPYHRPPPSTTASAPATGHLLGGTRKIRITTLTRVKVLNTFKYKVKA